ncbi:MAG: asparagine synthase (glutamine-hydrolyzing) [bacterium]|nr:asparagine synthase (glutamine-hydrolyzing) [bacterium]
MCGISGIISSSGEVKNPLGILRMGTVLQHRGPDFLGHYISPGGNVVLSHRRLSLVGLDGRSTVITIPKKDGSDFEIALVFNGEIYNFKELKNYFTSKGYVSVSPSDFEVIIFAYQEWGEHCVDHLIGEFAFVLFDEETGKTFVARDRTGVRPLFYSFLGDEFLFASEPKAILKFPGVSNEIDRSSIAEYVLMAHSFAAGNQNERSSFYKDIKQFPPGHYAFLQDNQLTITEYWDIPIKAKKDKAKSSSFLGEVLTRSVKDRIPDELPVAIALSGGLDSSIIVALATQFKEKKNITAFSIRYSGDDNEDFKHAKIMAEHCGITLSGPIITPQTMIEYINRCIVANDGPVDSIRRIGMFANYEAMREAGFKVALIGEGSDEFNLGYYHKFPGLKLDKEVCETAQSLKNAFLERAQYVKEFFTNDFLHHVSYDSIIDSIIETNYSKCQSPDPLDRMQYFYAKRFLQYLEDGNDRAAMANSIEARVPFVDPSFIEAALAVPIEDNITQDNEKMALRKAFEHMLPDEIAYRKKSAFPANEDLESHKLIAQEFKRNISRSTDGVWQIFNKKKMEKLSVLFDELLDSIEKGAESGKSLVSWMPLSQPVSLRTNQIFSLLTLLRWIDLYKLL